MGELNNRQRRFIAAMLLHPTIAEAADAAEIGRSTAHRYLSDPVVRAALAERQAAALAQSTTYAVAAIGDAVAILLDIAADPSASDAARVAAARAVWGGALKSWEGLTLEGRVTALEKVKGK